MSGTSTNGFLFFLLQIVIADFQSLSLWTAHATHIHTHFGSWPLLLNSSPFFSPTTVLHSLFLVSVANIDYPPASQRLRSFLILFLSSPPSTSHWATRRSLIWCPVLHLSIPQLQHTYYPFNHLVGLRGVNSSGALQVKHIILSQSISTKCISFII